MLHSDSLIKSITVDGLFGLYSYTLPSEGGLQNGAILYGDNGAGKSTLVRLLTRLYDPDTGSVRWDGDDIRTMDPDQFRKFFSVVFQDFML